MPDYLVYNWNPTENDFVESTALSYSFMRIDTERKMYLTSWRIWAGGHGYALYEYNDWEMQISYECEPDYVSDNEINVKEWQYINGEQELIYDKILTDTECDQFLLYDDKWQSGSEN